MKFREKVAKDSNGDFIYETVVYLQYFLPKQSFWRRVALGLRYILGKENPHGFYSETLLNEETVAKVVTFLTEPVEQE